MQHGLVFFFDFLSLQNVFDVVFRERDPSHRILFLPCRDGRAMAPSRECDISSRNSPRPTAPAVPGCGRESHSTWLGTLPQYHHGVTGD